MINIATWNINSVKARLDVVTAWLEKNTPDIVLLQEIKSTDETFPTDAFTASGYHVITKGQPSYNGVAVLSRAPLQLITDRLPGDEDDAQARFLHVSDGVTDYINIYAPNGNPTGTEKFTYKLAWLERLRAYAADLLAQHKKFLIGGDYNIIPTDLDAKHPDNWLEDALYQPESQRQWRALNFLGLTDAYRAFHPDEKDCYTFWDYQAGAFQRNNGIRIDHFLLSPGLADRLKNVHIDKEPRGWEKPSDHTPLVIALDL